MKSLLRRVLPTSSSPKRHKKAKTATVSSQSSIKGRRSSLVQFNEVAQIQTVLHILDYTTEEVEACWYNDFESNEFKEESNFIVQLHMTPGLMVDEDQYPRRGLESKLQLFEENEEENAREAQQRSIRVVLEEQDLLSGQKHTSFSQNRLATTYAMHTRGSEIRARWNALVDEASVLSSSYEDLALCVVEGHCGGQSARQQLYLREAQRLTG